MIVKTVEVKCSMKKIRKDVARKLYNRGDSVYLLPCKVRLDNEWMRPFKINKESADNRDFEVIVNTFNYYNCNSELGMRPSFYIEE